MSGIKVSVIVPVYNSERYLRECIDSVLNQTHENLELILVDDASADNSPAICDEYEKNDNRVTALHLLENAGQSSAQNAGFKIATGEYTYFFNDDDLLDKTAIEECVATAERERERETRVDFIYFAGRAIFEDDSLRLKRNPKLKYKMHYQTDKGYKVLSALLKNNDKKNALQMYFIRTEFIRKYGLEFCERSIYADTIYTATMFLRAEIVVHINKPLVTRRIRSDSLMITTAKDIRGFNSKYTNFYEFIKLYNCKDIPAEALPVICTILCKTFRSCMSTFAHLSASDKKSVISKRIELCNDMKNLKYLNSPAARLWSNRAITCCAVKINVIRKKLIWSMKHTA